MMYWDYSFPILIGSIALMLGTGLGLLILWAFVFLGCAGRPGSLPTCGACGYVVRGVSTLACPECGADLREAGIIGPRQKGRVNPLLFLLLWSMTLPVPVCIGSTLLMLVGPQEQFIDFDLSLKPKSGQYFEVSIYFEGAPFDEDRFEVATLSIYPLTANQNRGEIYTEVDLVAMLEDANFGIIEYDLFFERLSRADPPPSSAMTLDKARLLTLLQQVGADPALPTVDAEADELLAILANTPTVGPPTAGFTHFTHDATADQYYHYQAPWWGTFYIGVAAGFLIWVGGVVLFFRLRRPVGAAAG